MKINFTLLMYFANLLFITMGYAQDTFIQPSPDACGYYSWLGGPNKNHLAHDYNAPVYTEVKAISEGVVYKVLKITSGCFDPNTKYEVSQSFIWLKHRLNTGQYFYALYGHIEPYKNIKEDVRVSAGEVIGEIKECYVWYNDRLVPAPHLHFGIWHSEYSPPNRELGYGQIRDFVNPIKFLRDNKPCPAFQQRDEMIGILGKWIPEGTEKVNGKYILTIEFREDKTYLSTTVYMGKWEFDGLDQLKVIYNPPFDSIPLEIRVHSDKLHDSYDVEWRKLEYAHLIENTSDRRLWNKYSTNEDSLSFSVIEFKHDGTILNTIHLSSQYKFDGKYAKPYNIDGIESPWIYELKSGKLTVKLNENPDIMFTPFVRASITPLLFTSLTPVEINSQNAPFDAELLAVGTNFLNVNRVRFTWSGVVSGSVTWNIGDSDWNDKVTIYSDNSMTLRPRVVETSPIWDGTVKWNVILTDREGNEASQTFTVTYTEPHGDLTECQKHKGENGHTPTEEECLVAEYLFGGEPASIYNPWANCPVDKDGVDWCEAEKPGYIGGHSGIDMQTQDVATRRDKPFYSLSPGIVVADGSDSFGTIAIYDSDKDQTILYIHSNSSAVNTGQSVEIGTHLGGQGNKGLNVGENKAIHVHLEVQNGQVTKGADGANSTKEPIAAILEYLVISYSHDFDGIFYNLGIQLGGTVTSTLSIQESAVTGYMNFTNLPGESAICGAGNLSGTYSNGSIVGSFVSNDLDPGCGFDHGSIFYIDANLNSENTHYRGDYQPRNAGGSNIREEPGIFEAWISGSIPRRRRYQGTFLNTSYNRSGSVILEIALGSNTVSGYMNYTNWPGEPTICGAGEFTGLRRPDNTIQYSFISRDPDPGCGFDHGNQFLMEAAISTNLDTISGTYKVDRQGGVFSVTRAPSEEMDPFLSISPSTGKQLEVTFEISGSNFTPNGEVKRFVKFPNAEYQQISSITADDEGEVYWVHTPHCNYPVGDTNIYALDVSTNKESDEIVQVVLKSDLCKFISEFIWPRDNPHIVQNYGVRHTGIDIEETPKQVGPVYTVAEGEVVAIFKPTTTYSDLCEITYQYGCVIAYTNYNYPHTYTNPRIFNGEIIRDHAMQGVIIIKHSLSDNNIIYSLYAHLSEIEQSVEVGSYVSLGRKIGTTGGDVWTHVHLEIKSQPFRHDPDWTYDQGRPPYWGYVPATFHPDDFGYYSPWIYLKTMPSNQITKTPNKVQGSVTNFEDANILFIADVENPGEITVSFYNLNSLSSIIIKDVNEKLPPSVDSHSDFYWVFNASSGLSFLNGKIGAPLTFLTNIDDIDLDNIVWLKRKHIDEEWENLEGYVVGEYFESTVTFDSFSKFSIGFKSPVSVDKKFISLPSEYKLSQNYPNPFNPITMIKYDLPKESYVSLYVYNTLGQSVAILVDEHQHAGRYNVTFNSNDLPSGLYIYRLQAGEYVESRKMLYIR